MKILILSITAGHGHNQTANAAAEYLRSQGAECEILDALEYINPLLSESVSRSYLMSTKYSPRIYGSIYRKAELRDTDGMRTPIMYITDNILARKLQTYLMDFKPDTVVCTHAFSALLMTYINKRLMRRERIPFKTIGIITDFTIHPYWEDADMDFYVTASELLENQARKKGISPHRILPIGIPIHPKFGNKIKKFDARKTLKIPDITTVLVMSGSMGYGNVVKVIEDLDKSEMDFQIVSVCGSNKRLKKTIDNLELNKPIYNHGFVSNVDEFMSAADCIISKPGGLTTSESLAKGLPIIMVNPIPGQEDRNVEFLLNNGAAMKISSTFPADEAIFHLFASRVGRRNLRIAATMLGKPNAAKDLGDFILRGTF